ncbi:MAG: 4Fe-4S binding protein [Candidatus Diapherotrites archaeon]|nr:4Fe-4S binding protein [Candidatus Diapherotrites archaeon]
MKAQCNTDKCIYCGACVGVCPVGALTLDETRIVIDKKKCIGCGACAKICPAGAMTVKEGE